MIGYKVVEEDDRYYSALMIWNRVEYKIDKWVEGLIIISSYFSPLFVFKHKESAWLFMSLFNLNSKTMFECEYEPYIIEKDYNKQYWESIKGMINGSVLASKVKLKKRIIDNKEVMT